MARVTIRSRQRAPALCQPVETFSVGRHTVCGKVISARQSRISVATPTSFYRNTRGIYRRSRIGRPQNVMLAMAIRAIWRIRNSGLDRLAVHALKKNLGNFRVALSARPGNIPAAHAGLWVACRENVVRSVAVRTHRRILPLQHRFTMHALQVLLDGMRKRNLVPRDEPCVRVALRAGP